MCFRNQAVKTSEANDFIKVIAMTICKCVQLDPELSTRDEVIYECCRLLRNSCALGETVQNEIASYNSSSTINLFQSISIVMGKQSPISVSQKTRKMCWQLLANLCVQNEFTQHLIWQQCQNALVVEPQCACDTENARECTMILYNLFIGSCLSSADAKRIVEFLLECTKTSMRSHELDNNDFYHLFMEHLVTKHRNAVPIIDKLEPEKRLYIFYYIADHMKDPSHELIASNLLQYICREFKKKSDCVLKTVTSYVDSIHPKEVVALLDVIAQASPNEHYTHLLANDGSLFLNVGCLLQSITKIGGEANSQSIFAPVQRLEQLAPNSTDGASIERDISYQLKSTLIRTLGNLAYKNRKNQDLVRENSKKRV